jgi:Fe-S-cluster containining protein
MKNHPCQKCGACCAYFRVSFHWSEVLIESSGVPEELTVKIAPHQSAMLGTNQKNPRCISLTGVIGQNNLCQIYLNRPQACRNFLPSFEDGDRNERCEAARRSKGLAVLTLSDWL